MADPNFGFSFTGPRYAPQLPPVAGPLGGMVPAMRPTWSTVDAAPAPLGNPSENQALLSQWSQGLGPMPLAGAPAAPAPVAAGPSPAGLLPRSALAPGAPQRPLETLGRPQLSFGAFNSAGPSGPTGADPSKLALAPGATTGGGGAPGAGGAGPADWMAGMNPAEREWYNLIEAEKQAELRKRASAGRLVKGGKMQTSEATQGLIGPDADKLAAWRAARGQGAEIDKNLATFDRDVAFRRNDNAGDLLAEQQKGQERLDHLEAARTDALGQIRGQIDGMRAKVMNGEVDPDRLWNRAGDAKRAGFLVASALSGIGSALSGKPGAPNTALEGLFRMMDRDNANQLTKQNQDRQKLDDLQQIHDWTSKNFDSDRAGVAATNIARLEGMKQQFEVEYQNLAAKMPVYAGRDAQGNVLEKTPLDLRMDQARNAIDQRIAKEEMDLSREINGSISRAYGFTKDQMVGGSAGPSLAKLAGYAGAQSKLVRDAQKASADTAVDLAKAGASGGPVIYSNGQRYAVDPALPKDLASKYQDRVNMAEQGLATSKTIRANLKSAPVAGRLEKGARIIGLDRVADVLADEGRVLGADQLTGLSSQLSGAGVPSEVQARLMQRVMSGGPGAELALNEIDRALNSARQIGLQNLGVK